MNLAITMYLIGLLGNVAGVSIVILVVSALTSAILLVLAVNEKYGWSPDERYIEACNLYAKKLALLVIIPAAILAIIIPSKTDMYIMAGLVVGEKIITSEKGNELMDKSYELLVSKIEEATSESNKEK